MLKYNWCLTKDFFLLSVFVNNQSVLKCHSYFIWILYLFHLILGYKLFPKTKMKKSLKLFGKRKLKWKHYRRSRLLLQLLLGLFYLFCYYFLEAKDCTCSNFSFMYLSVTCFVNSYKFIYIL